MVPVFRSLFQPTDALVRVPDFVIIGDKQFAQGKLGLRQTMPCRLVEPVFCLSTVWDQQRTVPVELPHQILSVGVAALCQPLQFLRRAVPVGQGEGIVLNNLPQFPAGIGLALHLLRFVMPGQVNVLEGDLLHADALRLLDDSVLDLPELLLLGQFFLLSGLVVVVAVHLTLEDAPLVVALFHYRQCFQPVHYLVHGFLDGLGQVAVGLLTLDRLQLSG